MSKEEQVLEQILSAVADVRVDIQLVGYLLSSDGTEAKQRLYSLVETAKSFDRLAAGDTEDQSEDSFGEGFDESEEKDTGEAYILSSSDAADEELAEKWFYNVDLLEEGRLSDEQITNLLVDFVEDETIFGYTDGIDEALARRIVFSFSDGTLLSYSAGEGVILSHLTDELTLSDWTKYSYLDEYGTPIILSNTNGFMIVTGDEGTTLLDSVKAMEEKLNESAKVIIPMNYIAERNSEDGLEEYLSQAGVDEEDEEDESLIVYTAAFKIFELIANASLPFKREVEYVEAEDYMPAYSGYGKFIKMLDILEAEYGWGVIRDECCGSCAGGSGRDFRSQEGFENASIFYTWSQNSNSYWGTSGWISHQHYTADEKEIVELTTAAVKAGVNVTIEDSHLGNSDTKVLNFS